MGRKINIYWYRYNEGNGNFGDELSPFLISKLTGLDLNYIDVTLLGRDRWQAFKDLSYRLKVKKINPRKYLKYLIYIILKPPVLLCIGSLLQPWTYDRTIVWGSGVLSSKGKLPNARYLSVRGLKTIDRLKQQGYKAPQTIGDPALLLPKVYTVKNKQRFKVGIILHYFHLEKLENIFGNEVLTISLLDNIDTIIDQITSCEMTISTSLHGLIVSHTYGIKSLWAKLENHELNNGDNIKFQDYFSSVKINDYLPIDLKSLTGMRDDLIYNKICKEYSDILLPQRGIIEDLQKGLLSSFPYQLKSEIKF